MKQIKKSKLPELIEQLKKDYDLIGPCKDGDLVLYRKLEKDELPFLGFKNSIKSPKELFFPQTEEILRFRGFIDRRIPEAIEEKVKKRIVIGMRPCDIQSLLIIDKLFINDDYVDSFYDKLRENTLIIGFGCSNPASSCFCTSLGGGPFIAKGSDVFMVDIGQGYLLEHVSEKGKKLIEQLPEASEDMIAMKQDIEKKASKSISSIDVEAIPEKLKTLFENPIWEEISERCLGCGVCTYLCPTCHCFDIQDEVVDNKGRRVRNWDSCMFPIFTLHGSGHQPREFRYQRMRQRIMHKFNYYRKNFGVIACSGCGRCVAQCPVNIDVREVIGSIKNIK